MEQLFFCLLLFLVRFHLNFFKFRQSFFSQKTSIQFNSSHSFFHLLLAAHYLLAGLIAAYVRVDQL